MPPGEASTVTDTDKLDALAFLLQQNGFASGSSELRADSEALASRRTLVDTDGPRAGALVQATGCLRRADGQSWILTNAAKPVATTLAGGIERFAAERRVAGEAMVRLLNVFPKPGASVDQIVGVKGLLIEGSDGLAINVVLRERLGPAC